MPISALTGTLLRDRRLTLGARQADVAEAAGISASYLNLIEHNRRKVGPAVLERLAGALGLEVSDLDGVAADALTQDLRAAAARVGALARPELDRTEDFAGRFPGWAAALSVLHARVQGLERAVEALNDRLGHDPHLSAALHEVLSAVSSVRSTSAILAETEDIDPDWRARFHRNLHEDSERLATGAEALVAYLDRAEQPEAAGAVASPQEELEQWLAARGWHLPETEVGDPGPAGVPPLASQAARQLAAAHLAQAAADARALPLGAVQDHIARDGDDPARLAARFGTGLLPVFRRLASLPGSRAGLVICDASGALLFRKPAEGFSLPRFGAACPLWPLFAALARPMTPVQAIAETAGRTGSRVTVLAWCEPRHPAGFAGPEVREAAMLIRPADGAPGEALLLGPTCRICPRAGCPARREPSVLGTV